MTVQQLVKVLNKFPKNLEVFINCNEGEIESILRVEHWVDEDNEEIVIEAGF